MKTLRVRFISFLAVITIFVGAFSPSGGAAADETSVDGVTHSLVVSHSDELTCRRDLSGRITFDWPHEDVYFDVVLIQDASGSFTNTMPDVKKSLKAMVSGLRLDPESNGYPRDRAMLVTYQGSDGFGLTQLDGTVNYEYYSWFGYKVTSTGLTTDAAVLEGAIDAITPLGATPTIDGLVRAKDDYADAIAAPDVWNQTEYLSDGEFRHRQTVYLLITDGGQLGLLPQLP